MYVAVFGLAALAKLAVWNHAVKHSLTNSDADELLERRIARRSLAVPIGCLVCMLLSLILSVSLAFLGFPLIPLFAYLLDPGKTAKISAAE
jgi:hypothetical protein